MNKLQKVETALINQARLDPADFTLRDYYGGMEVIHKETGARIKVETKGWISTIASHLIMWAYFNDIPELSADARSKAWCKWKGYAHTRTS